MRVLDVGCGDGILSGDLVRAGVSTVIGLDRDAGVLARARQLHHALNITWVLGDIHEQAFEPDSFDAVVSVAALHHMDAASSLTRFAQLTKPGGVVAVVGLAASEWHDLPLAAAAFVARQLGGLTWGRWEHTAPAVWPPPLTYGDMKRLSARVLPGVRYQRHLLGRYSLVWRKPERDTTCP